MQAMNNFVLEPTHENLERYKRVQGEETYWHTADFFLFDPNIKNELSIIFDSYMEAFMESDEEDEDEASRKIAFSLGRMIVKAAREIGVSPKDFRDQFNNYATVIWTPICIWRKENLGEISYSLMSGLQCSSEKILLPPF